MSAKSAQNDADWTDFVRLLLILVGAGLMAYGAWLIQPAYGYLTGGCTLFFGLLAAQIAIARSRKR